MTATADLHDVLKSGSLDDCVRFFAGMGEKERREFAPEVARWLKSVRKNPFSEDADGTLHSRTAWPVAEAAFLATATISEIRKAGRRIVHDVESTFAILQDRNPQWINEWINLLLDDTYYWALWPIVRRFVQAGAASKPDVPKYYLGMITGLAGRFGNESLAEVLAESPDLLEQDIWKLFEFEGGGENSLANSDRFGNNSWAKALFKLASSGRLSRNRLLASSLAALQRDFNHYRARWFCEFYDSLDPNDEELRAHGPLFCDLLRASAPNVARWAWNKVEGLAENGTLDPEILVAAIEPVLQLKAKGTVKQALNLLERVASSNKQAGAPVALLASQALGHEQTDVQKSALSLIERFGDRSDPQLNKSVMRHGGAIASSLRKRLALWLDRPGKVAPARPEPKKEKVHTISHPLSMPGFSVDIPDKIRGLFSIDQIEKNSHANLPEVPAAIFDGADLPRLCGSEIVTPIADLDELVDVCARVIEDPTLVDDAERCFDGLSRLCALPADTIADRFGPLMKRVARLISGGATPFCGIDPSQDLMGAICAFCTGELIEVLPGPANVIFRGRETSWDGWHIVFRGVRYAAMYRETDTVNGFLSRRIHSLARRIAARNQMPLISTPTTKGGWIDPRVFAARVQSLNGEEPEPRDLALGLLRLAPEHRQEALAALPHLKAEWMDAIRYALGDKRVAVGQTAWLWITAARSLAPFETDQVIAAKFPGFGPDAGEASSLKMRCCNRTSGGFSFVDTYVDSIPKVPRAPDLLLPTVLMHSQRSCGKHWAFESTFAGRSVGAIRWTASVCPLARDSFFAGAIRCCFGNIDWCEANWQNRAYLEPLLDTGVPLRKIPLLFLTGMLAAKEPGEYGLATDVAIQAIEAGRLGTDNFGEAMREMLTTGLIKPGRWQKTLANVACSSPVHALTVFTSLQRCFEGRPGDLPKDYPKLLELMVELSAGLEIPANHPPFLKFLATIEKKGKAGKFAGELLAGSGSPLPVAVVHDLLERAIEMRLLASKRYCQPDCCGEK
jgi:Family of unknown function (DUF6493)